MQASNQHTMRILSAEELKHVSGGGFDFQITPSYTLNVGLLITSSLGAPWTLAGPLVGTLIAIATIDAFNDCYF